MLSLLSNYKMKSIPVVDVDAGRIDNIITQPAVIHILAECAGLQWFESWGTKNLSEVGLPVMTPNCIIKVCNCLKLKFCNYICSPLPLHGRS